MSLTGKQALFVTKYLGEARFNATAAAKLAGYRATSKHSFESIGSENLTRPGIRAAIDEHFRLSRMGAEEVLIELTTLARGNSKDKIKALALLSTHHGLLDGKWQGAGKDPVTLRVVYEEKIKWQQEVDEWKDGIEKEINELNGKGLKIYNDARAKFADSPDVKAFCELYEKMLGGKVWAESETIGPVDEDIMLPTQKPVEVIPPERRLEPAPVERMMAQVIEAPAEPMVLRTYIGTPEPKPAPEPELCAHGHALADCYNCKNFGDDYIDVTTNEKGEQVYQFGQAARQQTKRRITIR